MDTATSSGWPVARIIHREVMGKIEQGALQWEDKDGMWQARVDAKSDLCLGKIQFNIPVAADTPAQYNSHSFSQPPHHQSRQYTSNSQQKRQALNGPRKELPCIAFNRNYCKEHFDHNDSKIPHRYLHVCEFCFYRSDVEHIRHKGKSCIYNPRFKPQPGQ